MQVRDRQVRGFAHHLARLDAANRELFGIGVDDRVLRSSITHALGDDADASVRVYLHETAAGPALMVTVRPPGGMPPGPWRLKSVPYQRSVAHIKRTADFGQRYYQQLVQASGYDEALLTGHDGIISEGSITNLGCFDRPADGVDGSARPQRHHDAACRAGARRARPAFGARARAGRRSRRHSPASS